MKHILSDGWSILPTEITTIQNNVWKIETKEQSYALKRSELKEENLYFVCDAEKALTRNGFSRFAALIPTTAEHPYYATQDGLFTLHQWLDGERCDFTREDHLFAAAETLADFHNHGNARELQNYNSRRGDHFDHAEHITYRLGELRSFYQIATASPSAAFTQRYLRDYPKLISKARESYDRLLCSSYPTLIRRAEETGAFIHYDVAARNFIIKEHRAYLIDFDYCCCDLPLTDLMRLWKRGFKQGENYTGRIESIIKGYRQHRTICEEEFDVLYAMLLFPQKHWRIAHRYFTDKQKKDEAFYLKKWHTANEEFEKEQIWLPQMVTKRRDIIES